MGPCGSGKDFPFLLTNLLNTVCVCAIGRR